MSVLAVDCLISVHTVKLKILSDPNCQSCIEEGEVEIFRHCIPSLSSFTRLWLKHLDSPIFAEPGDIVGIDISGIGSTMDRLSQLSR